MKKTNNYYEVNLPYYKKGDDLSWCIQNTKSDVEAFRLHAEQLRSAAEILERLAVCAADGNMKIENADTHCISVSATRQVGDMLKEENILYQFEDDEDFDDELEEGDESDEG